MSKVERLQQSRERFLFDGFVDLRPPDLGLFGLRAAIEMTRHVPDGITPHEFFNTATKDEILAVYDASIRGGE